MIKIAILGVGLIGGSLALCFKGKPNIHVIGHSPNPSSVEKYLLRGVVDEGTTSLSAAVEDADVIFVCVPVGLMSQYLQLISECRLKSGAIITDVGSTKAEIVNMASAYRFNDAVFIGGHPMAGKERSGVEAATSKLFVNAFYVLTPTQDTPQKQYDSLVELLALTHANIVTIEAELHDEIVGAVSHLPHIIAAMLVNLVADANKNNDHYEKLAAGGFRDITRIASSDPYLWRDVSVSNRKVLISLLQEWTGRTKQFIEWLEQNEVESMLSQFQMASKFRSSLPERRVGVLSTVHEFYVELLDEPGAIGKLTTLLGQEQINLRNIGIHDKKPGVSGSLHLSFGNEIECEKAKFFLSSKGFHVHY
jgi:prephenate dehydrogenase